MTIGTPWIGTTQQGNGNIAPATSYSGIDVSGATNGEVVFIFGTLGDSQTAAPTFPAGWNQGYFVQESVSGASSMCLICAWKVKASSDTTIAISWPVSTRFQFTPISWPGLDTTTPIEQAVSQLHTSGSSYPTASGTPTSNDRWACMHAGCRGSTAIVAWTPDAALTDRANFTGTTSPFIGQDLADSNGAVAQSAQSYTATGQTASHGATELFFLVPSSAGAPPPDVLRTETDQTILLEDGTAILL